MKQTSKCPIFYCVTINDTNLITDADGLGTVFVKYVAKQFC